jgi:hypothetical protein
MTRMSWKATAIVLGLFLPSGGVAKAGLVNLQSGNGTIGGTDSAITFLAGPTTSDFPTVLTPGNFTSAQTGPAAFIVSHYPTWIASLTSDPTAQWISTTADGAINGGNPPTGLYAIAFNLDGGFSSATLSLTYAVDNQLGSSLNEGVYLNGSAISGDSTGGGFLSATTITRSDVASLLHAGTNYLYIDAVNRGEAGGLIFSATITTSSVVPEPSSLVMVSIGMLTGLGLWAHRKGATTR